MGALSWLLRVGKSCIVLVALRRATGPEGTATEARTNRSGFVVILSPNQRLQNLVGGLHRHAAEVRDEMCTLSVASDTAFYKNPLALHRCYWT